MGKKSGLAKRVLWWGIALAIVLGTGGYFVLKDKNKEAVVHRDKVVRENLSRKITATGTINPLQTVEVGTQVSGTVSELYVDFNDVVKAGQVIARMDTRTLLSAMKESEASLKQADVRLKQAKRELVRVEKLYNEGAVSTSDFEIARDNYQLATATYSSVKLQLERSRVNLGYATITSPIDGVVISRKVDVGQTVAAAFATPAIYVIAEDLEKMKIEACVDEADIGQVKRGQSVSFTVDAYPESLFYGIVEQIQLEPVTLQNVVTYTVEILVDNPDLKLMPGMTANLEIIIASRENILTVPNGVFQFQMNSSIEHQLKELGYVVQHAGKEKGNMIWLFTEKALVQKEITKGYTNGIKTEISGDIQEGDEMVSRIEFNEGKEQSGRSFFMPQQPDDKKEKEKKKE